MSGENLESSVSNEVYAILPAVIEYYISYSTDSGFHVTLKIISGPNIAVNTILGVIFIKPAQLSLDVSNDVVTA